MPYLQTLSTFRDNVRDFAKEKKPHTDFLALSDKLRDDDLVELGVLLDDQEGKSIESVFNVSIDQIYSFDAA